jgi:uncharacterized phage protein (TIGR01671 family)
VNTVSYEHVTHNNTTCKSKNTMENRVIKFRAWHSELQKMFSAEEMGEDQLTIMPDGRGFVNVSGASTRLSKFYTSMIPMQFTGLVDSKGVEIYEGDVVKYVMPAPDGMDTEYIEEVHFSYGSFDVDGCPLYVVNETCEVIGNLYQHPSLLK